MRGPLRLRTALLAAALLTAASAAQEGDSGSSREVPPPWIPDHVRVQLAGCTGLLAAGGGWSFLRDRLEAEILYGFTPGSVSIVSVHTLAQKSTVAPIALSLPEGIELHPLLLGYSANFALGDNYILILPERYQGYYWPSAVHFWLFAGTRAGLRNPGPGAIRKVAAVAEVGAVDFYWQVWRENSVVGLDEILSLSLAVQIHFLDG